MVDTVASCELSQKEVKRLIMGILYDCGFQGISRESLFDEVSHIAQWIQESRMNKNLSDLVLSGELIARVIDGEVEF